MRNRRRIPFAYFLALVISIRGWWRSFKALRTILRDHAELRTGDTVSLTVYLSLVFPEYEDSQNTYMLSTYNDGMNIVRKDLMTGQTQKLN